MKRQPARTMLAAHALLLAAVACGSRTGLLVPGASGTGPGSCDALDSSAGGGCPSVPGGYLPPDSSLATGSITGARLRVAFCPGAMYARIVRSVSGPAPYFFEMDSLIGGTSVTTPYDFQSPPGASDGVLGVLVDLDSNVPGDYTSATERNTQLVSFSYDVPIPCFACSAAPASAPSDCPPGCSTVCSHYGCLPCRPDWPVTTYSAGAWELVLTSDPAGPDAGTGLEYFTPHGTFTATLVLDTDGGTETATLSASF